MLPFIPRKVARKSARTQLQAQVLHNATKLEPTAGPSTSSAVHLERSTSTNIEVLASPSLKGKERGGDTSKPTLPERAYADLLCLSLSEHSLWLDPDLRRAVESNTEGYIPLTYTIHHSPYLSILTPSPSEATLVKAIRAHAADKFDVRVLFSAPSRAIWYGQTTSPKDNAGGYEVRLKDWENILGCARNSSREEWETRTVYMENIPLQYRSISSIYRFTCAILQQSPTGNVSTPESSALVQSISLPRHHQDKPTDNPKCKGFALVTLTSKKDAERLVQEWTWHQRIQETKSAMKENAEIQEATRFGFRVIRKSRWNQLKEEYLARRVELLNEIARANQSHDDTYADDSEPVFAEDLDVHDRKRQRTPSPPPVKAVDPAKPVTTLSSSYPYHCLVFVRNVHPETNKTTLRTLFSRAFESGALVGESGLDYVDFNKGMDTCYLRLATSEHTTQLITHLTQNPTVQTQGLDSTGSPVASKSEKAIMLELVDGKREELYWGKVPEKVRRQAVEKAVGWSVGMTGKDDLADGGEGESGQKKRRKRHKGN